MLGMQHSAFPSRSLQNLSYVPWDGVGMGLLLHLRNRQRGLKGRFKAGVQRTKAQKAGEVCWVFYTHNSTIALSALAFLPSWFLRSFHKEARLLMLTPPSFWGL